MTRTLLALTLLATAASGCEPAPAEASPADAPALPYYADGDFTPHWFDTPEAVPDTFHAVPAFALTDQEGRTVTEADLDGKTTVANFFFTTCPGICPATTANMVRVQREFADDDGVVMLSHSVTPEADSVAALADFAERTGVLAARWRLVTGSQDAIYELGKSAYFADEDMGETMARADAAFTHTESFYLLDGDRRIRGVYDGMNSVAVAQLVEDVRTLQAEARSL